MAILPPELLFEVASFAHPDVLQRLRSLYRSAHGIPVHHRGDVTVQEALIGEVSVSELEWYHAYYIITEEDFSMATVATAMSLGRVDVMQWLHEHFSARVYDILMWRDGSYCLSAVCNGRLAAFQWVFQTYPAANLAKVCLPRDGAIHRALYHGHLHIVEWLYEQLPDNVRWEGELPWVISRGHLHILRWMFQYIPSCRENLMEMYEVMFLVGKNGQLEVLKWLFSEYQENQDFLMVRFPRLVELALIEAHIHILDWVRIEFPDYCRNLAMQLCIKHHMCYEIVKYEVLCWVCRWFPHLTPA